MPADIPCPAFGFDAIGNFLGRWTGYDGTFVKVDDVGRSFVDYGEQGRQGMSHSLADYGPNRLPR